MFKVRLLINIYSLSMTEINNTMLSNTPLQFRHRACVLSVVLPNPLCLLDNCFYQLKKSWFDRPWKSGHSGDWAESLVLAEAIVRFWYHQIPNVTCVFKWVEWIIGSHQTSFYVYTWVTELHHRRYTEFVVSSVEILFPQMMFTVGKNSNSDAHACCYFCWWWSYLCSKLI